MSIDSVAKHPVPSRLSQGSEVPHIGPNFEAYQKAHAESVGPAADKWWAKVCIKPRETSQVLTPTADG